MARYKKKPVFVEAVQWLKHGDHPAVKRSMVQDNHNCAGCGQPMELHGWAGSINDPCLCPGDYVITSEFGWIYTMGQEEFQANYEPAEEELST